MNSTHALPLAHLALALCAVLASPAAEMPGGANAPAPTPPPTLAVAGAELACAGFAVQVPAASWAGDGTGDPLLPAPVMALRRGDGPWLGFGYLEPWSQPVALRVERNDAVVRLDYRFDDGRSWRVTLTGGGAALLIDEETDLGPRDTWVFDCFYGMLPTAGVAMGARGATWNFLTLPCFYDQAEALMQAGAGRPDAAAGLAVIAGAATCHEMVACWIREPAAWQGAEGLTAALWQRRQLAGRPGSRHWLGPETKSDTTPNPRTAALLGTSLYEGHVTMEFRLGPGRRRLAMALIGRPAQRERIAPAIAAAMRSAP